VLGYGVFVVRKAESGRFVGEVGLMDSRRESEPSFEGIPEMGWALRSDAQGNGFAREALFEVLRWADQKGLRSTAAIVSPDNVRSLRLAVAAGYRSRGDVRTSGLVLRLLMRDVSELHA
jgi:RimJ/RimL family protein N-acetyltransferase